ncbi:2-dehydro-3-deoxygluconokinase [Aequitasia blattaphilus]|uniref:Sugar kinase n=1 Tax=Aequitasia blattaphilus TaxID=2949332 RepID=A0ABT1E516_9FIRM|nr:sugar kinase [Aequitasia blattaphilus]MCP1100925.1 sugar kinase [Aequitasia blattaphilus]MCR8613565.1 sugar kinase [Aequitasia blattaphilus]
MSKDFDLLTLGEILLRLSPPDNERIDRGDLFYKQVGGAELNVASGVSLLGLRTGIISKLPQNSLGRYVKNRVRFFGVSDDYLTYDAADDQRLGIYYYENGAYPRKPSVVYDRDYTSIHKINLNDYDASLFSSARIFHTTGIMLALGEHTRATTIEMIKRFKERGTLISFDVNFRGNLWTGEEARKTIEEILPFVDIFFCSEDTAKLTFKKNGALTDMMKEFSDEYNISVVASTQRIVHSPKIHDFGSVIYDAEKDYYYTEDPYKSIDVVDRIGSGDAYISGVLYGLLSTNMDCEKALQYGNATGSVKNTIPGDMPSSTLDEIERIIKEHQNTGIKLEMDR